MHHMKSLPIAMAAWVLALSAVTLPGPALADSVAKFNKAGELSRPTGYREWIYIGAPLTPNDMNNGKAAFPEFHNVYIDPASYAHWKRTGSAPERFATAA